MQHASMQKALASLAILAGTDQVESTPPSVEKTCIVSPKGQALPSPGRVPRLPASVHCTPRARPEHKSRSGASSSSPPKQTAHTRSPERKSGAKASPSPRRSAGSAGGATKKQAEIKRYMKEWRERKQQEYEENERRLMAEAEHQRWEGTTDTVFLFGSLCVFFPFEVEAHSVDKARGVYFHIFPILPHHHWRSRAPRVQWHDSEERPVSSKDASSLVLTPAQAEAARDYHERQAIAQRAKRNALDLYGTPSSPPQAHDKRDSDIHAAPHRATNSIRTPEGQSQAARDFFERQEIARRAKQHALEFYDEVLTTPCRMPSLIVCPTPQL